jgi:hypothetical protein
MASPATVSNMQLTCLFIGVTSLQYTSSVEWGEFMNRRVETLRNDPRDAGILLQKLWATDEHR